MGNTNEIIDFKCFYKLFEERDCFFNVRKTRVAYFLTLYNISANQSNWKGKLQNLFFFSKNKICAELSFFNLKRPRIKFNQIMRLFDSTLNTCW